MTCFTFSTNKQNVGKPANLNLKKCFQVIQCPRLNRLIVDVYLLKVWLIDYSNPEGATPKKVFCQRDTIGTKQK
jgi:hypothetical protein